jgi:hypothetical protein
MAAGNGGEVCALTVDAPARRWLDEHRAVSRLFIAYMSSRACCSGAEVCDVRIRVDAAASRRATSTVTWVPLGSLEGRDVFIDSRLIDRMPASAQLGVRGVGRFRRLDLDLTGDQWADLLYPVPN